MNKLTTEQIASNLAAYKHAMEVGHTGDVEVFACASWQASSSFMFPDSPYRLRPKPPEPRWRQWNYDNCPVGLQIKHKKTSNCYMIVGRGIDSLLLNGWITYAGAFESYTQLDGQPAGVLE